MDLEGHVRRLPKYGNVTRLHTSQNWYLHLQKGQIRVTAKPSTNARTIYLVEQQRPENGNIDTILISFGYQIVAWNAINAINCNQVDWINPAVNKSSCTKRQFPLTSEFLSSWPTYRFGPTYFIRICIKSTNLVII